MFLVFLFSQLVREWEEGKHGFKQIFHQQKKPNKMCSSGTQP